MTQPKAEKRANGGTVRRILLRFGRGVPARCLSQGQPAQSQADVSWAASLRSQRFLDKLGIGSQLPADNGKRSACPTRFPFVIFFFVVNRRLHQPQLLQADVVAPGSAVAEDDVVEHRDVEKLAGFDEPLRDGNVFAARRRVATRMIVDENHRRG